MWEHALLGAKRPAGEREPIFQPSRPAHVLGSLLGGGSVPGSSGLRGGIGGLENHQSKKEGPPGTKGLSSSFRHMRLRIRLSRDSSPSRGCRSSESPSSPYLHHRGKAQHRRRFGPSAWASVRQAARLFAAADAQTHSHYAPAPWSQTRSARQTATQVGSLQEPPAPPPHTPLARLALPSCRLVKRGGCHLSWLFRG